MYSKPYGLIKLVMAVIINAAKKHKYVLEVLSFRNSPIANIKIKAKPITKPPWVFAQIIFNIGKHHKRQYSFFELILFKRYKNNAKKKNENDWHLNVEKKVYDIDWIAKKKNKKCNFMSFLSS